MTGQRNYGLDLMRSAAILGVLASHLVPHCIPFGIAGVEWFFVLSGYLVGGIFCRSYLASDSFGGMEIVRFWRRRWWRTLPNYYLFIIIFFCLAVWVGGSSPSLNEVGLCLVFLQNFAWVSPEFFNISWSLAVEEAFYILLPLGVVLWERILKSKVGAIVACALMFITVCFVWRFFSPIVEGDWDSGMRKVVIGRLDALQWGVLLSLVSYRSPLVQESFRWLVVPGAILTVFCIGVTYVQYPSGTRPLAPSVMFALWPIGAAACIPFLVSLERPSGRLEWVSTAVENVSKWSYSIYLSHLPVKHSVAKVSGDILGDGKLSWVVEKSATVVLIFFVSRFLYLKFEVPMMNLRKPERLPGGR